MTILQQIIIGLLTYFGTVAVISGLCSGKWIDNMLDMIAQHLIVTCATVIVMGATGVIYHYFSLTT